jgi:tetratricopeptide (TPR) repeat protein
VLGKVFWSGALAEMGGRKPGDVEQALHELSRKELVRPSRTSSMEGEAEFGFWHLLVRDVCYAQIPRAARAARHRTAADWIEKKAGERAEDLADVLAHHYLSALELSLASGQTAESKELQASAIRYLALAGERALPLDVEHAEQSLAKSLALAPAGDPERAGLLERWAQAAQQRNRLTEAQEALEEALALYREQEETVAAGRVLSALSLLLRRLGDPRREEALEEALELLESQPPGPELVTAYAQLAGARSFGAAYREAIAATERALALAAELGLPQPVRALGRRGFARACLGERHGLDDMRRALELAIERGEGREAAILHNNFALATWQYEGPQTALAACREGIDFCRRRGIAEIELGLVSMSLGFLAELGRPEQALSEAEPLAERLHEAGAILFVEPRALQLHLLSERGDHEHAANPNELVARVRDNGEPQLCAFVFAAAARLLLAGRQPQRAQALLSELEQMAGIRAEPNFVSILPGLVRTALALDDATLARSLVEGVQPVTPLAGHALVAGQAQLAEAGGDHAQAATLYADAAERWRDFGNVPERAYAMLGHGHCLVALDTPEAGVPLREARELFASMGYKPALAQAEALLGESEAATG